MASKICVLISVEDIFDKTWKEGQSPSDPILRYSISVYSLIWNISTMLIILTVCIVRHAKLLKKCRGSFFCFTIILVNFFFQFFNCI